MLQFSDLTRFYIASDNELMIDILKGEINFLKSAWQNLLGRPLVTLALRRTYLGLSVCLSIKHRKSVQEPVVDDHFSCCYHSTERLLLSLGLSCGLQNARIDSFPSPFCRATVYSPNISGLEWSLIEIIRCTGCQINCTEIVLHSLINY